MPEVGKNAGGSVNSVLVFMKLPVPGRVKTRLAASIGSDAAAKLYGSWISHVLGALQPLRPAVRVVGYIDGGEPAEFALWDELVDCWLAQPQGDLGFRIAFGFEKESTAGPALAIGTDCLDLNARVVESAFSALEDADAVFGPASDGGYYLVGIRRPIPGMFEDVRWSSEWTLADQLGKCSSLGLKAALLPVLEDIDTFEDWERRCARTGSVP